MGHYASEMGDDRPRSSAATGYDNREVLDKFFGGKAPTGSSTCPRCGAGIKWTWMDVDSLLLHIKWHENLAAWVRGASKPYPGLEV